MKNKGSGKSPQRQKATPVTKKRSSLWIVVVVIAVASVSGVLWRYYNTGKGTTSTVSTSSSAPVTTHADKDQLLGRWTRTDSDGAYVIEIKNAAADGKLEASYFNPNPIKVGRAEWQKKDNNLIIIVELRDVNYPGSTYTLNFMPAEGRMMGNYYQAVEGTNFDVAFVRSR